MTPSATPTTAASASGVALYVHTPFCETKCPYCDFNTYAKLEALIPGYVSAVRAEIAMWGELLGAPDARTVFFGGGTPSYLPSEELQGIMASIREAFSLGGGAEVTLEANPGDVTPRKLAAWRAAGVNRMSIGVQSFDDELLRLLGRRHTAEEAAGACRRAQKAGFDNVSLDLMYGLPHQTLDHWRSSLAGVSDLLPAHVSLYALTLEGGTPMQRDVAQGALPTPDGDLAADMYDLAREWLGALGYRRYEISNWALAGKRGLHNIVYWRNEPYVGVGPGAHSSLAGHRFSNLKPPREYVQRMRSRESSAGARDGLSFAEAIRCSPVVGEVEVIDRRLEMAETMMLGMRLDVGVSIQEFSARFGESPLDVYADALGELTTVGLIEIDGESVRLAPEGMFVSNEAFVRFFE